jgi:hypothetical protein
MFGFKIVQIKLIKFEIVRIVNYSNLKLFIF